MAEDKIPKGRIRRSAKLGTAMGTQATRYAGTRAANVARGSGKAERALEGRHLETALKMASILGEMKGAAMKIGQLASFIDTEFLPPEYAELYQEQLAKLRTSAPAMPWDKVSKVLEEEYLGEPLDELFESIEEEAFAAASIGQVHRATLHDGRAVAVKIQYPGIAEALESDLRNAGMIMRLARAIAPGLDAKAAAAELRLRVMEELDYEYEAQSHRSFARAYRGHPFIHVPDVLTRLSHRRVLVTEYVDGMGFEEVKQLPQEEKNRFGEIVFRFCFGSIYHLQMFNADAHPGNYILMGDGRVAFLDFGMTKRLDAEQIELEPFLNDAMRVVSGRANDKRLKLTARLGRGIRLTADHRLLKQIVLNLLSNAVKFTPEGGRVTIRARATSGWVSISIADTGIGIPEEALARLGRPFEQVESQLTKSHQGSGLGLAIAKSLTELHHGAMRIRSTPGIGTMVLLRLPIRRTAAHKEELAEAAA